MLFAGVILSTEESISAVRLAVDYVNELGLIGPNHRLTVVANTTGDIATTDAIQIGNAYSLIKSDGSQPKSLLKLHVINSLFKIVFVY